MTNKAIAWTVAALVALCLYPGTVGAQSWTAPRTWATGDLVSATEMNAQLRDNLLVLSTSINTADGTIRSTSNVKNEAAGTGSTYLTFINTSGSLWIGDESSVGGATFTNSTAYASMIGTTTTTPLQFVTNNAVVAQLNSTGELGINIAPSYYLDVKNPFSSLGANFIVHVTTGTATDSVAQLFQNTDEGFIGVDSSVGGVLATSTTAYALVLGTGNTTPIQFAPNKATEMTILPSGFVGIGTASPQAKLETSGTVRIDSIADALLPALSSGTGIEMFYAGTSDYGGIIAYDRSGSAYKSLRLDGSVLALNSASGGNVGIGTSSPTQTLDVAGTVNASGAYYANGTIGATHAACSVAVTAITIKNGLVTQITCT